MKRRKLAVLLAAAMTVTAVPAGSITTYAEEFSDGFTEEAVENISAEETDSSEETLEEETENFAAESFSDNLDETEEFEDGFISADQSDLEGEAQNFQSTETQETSDLVSAENVSTLDADEDGDGDDDQEFYVDYGKSVTMNASIPEGWNVAKIQWYEWDENSGEKEISGVNEATYIISSAAETKNYTCKITNSDGAVKEQNFWVEVRRIVTYERQEERVVSKGEAVELEMSAKSLAEVELTYQWYKGTDGPGYIKMEGENSSKLSIGKVTSSSLVYYCEVGDGIVSQMYRFLIRVDTGLVFKNTNTKLKGKVGEKVVFNSEAVAEAGEEQITYQWYATDEEEEDQLIDGATKATYEAVVGEKTTAYLCRAYDSCGNGIGQRFTVEKETEISVGKEQEVYVKRGENAVLKAEATSNSGKDLSYQWFVYDKFKDEFVKIEGANSAAYEVKNVTAKADYQCIVSDGVDEAVQQFNVMIDIGFKVETPSWNQISVKRGTENLRLEVSVKADQELKYEWYVTGEEGKVKLEGEEKNSYIIQKVTGARVEYECKISNGQESSSVEFWVEAEPDITVSAEENVWVPYGNSANLSVNVKTGENCGKVTYRWLYYVPSGYRWGHWWSIRGAENASLTTSGITNIRGYKCVITDETGCYTSVCFTVGPDTLKSSAATGFDNPGILVPETRCKVSLEYPGIYKVYKFVPDRSGLWNICSVGELTQQAWLYDDQLNELANCNIDVTDESSAVNFKIQYKLEKGKTYYIKCGNSDNTYEMKSSFLIEANYVDEDNHEHQWNAGTVKTAATCAKTGTKVYTCTGCGQTKEETIPATGKHNMVTKIDKAATCGAAGSQHKECSVCGKKDAATAIPATGKHSFGEYTVTKAPTVLAAGVKTRTCKVCGKTETAVVAKLNGTIKVVSAKVPLQLKKKVALSKLVTGFTTGDSINAAACTSSKPSIAAISGGNVVAKKAGTTVITVKLASGASAQVTVVVQKKAVATSSITVPSTVNLTTGEKLKLTPVVSPVTSLNKVSYTSTNKKVATVTKDGVITAKKSGTATIKVKAGKKTKNVKVKVAKKAPTGMTGVPATKTLKKGKSFTIKAKLTPSGAEATIKYSSSNKKIATVNSKGKVTAKKAGTVTITVKAGNVTKTCVVTVKK